MRQWEIACKDADDVPDMLVNMTSGIYWGKSSSTVHNTKGRLFTSTLRDGRPVSYHCIAWNEL